MQSGSKRSIRVDRAFHVTLRRRKREKGAWKRPFFNHDTTCHCMRWGPDDLQLGNITVADFDARRSKTWKRWDKVDQICSSWDVAKLEFAFGSDRYFQNFLQINAGQ